MDTVTTAMSTDVPVVVYCSFDVPTSRPSVYWVREDSKYGIKFCAVGSYWFLAASVFCTPFRYHHS